MDSKPNDPATMKSASTGEEKSDLKEDFKRPPRGKSKTRMITIDVLCKQYTLIFANDPHPPNKPKSTRRARTPASKSTAAESTKLAETSAAAVPRSKLSTPSTTSSASQKSRDGGIKLTRISKKKSAEVLGSLNVDNNNGSPQGSFKQLAENNGNELKRRVSTKRKRFPGDDTEIAAENIPIEAVFPPLRFGVNKDICPKKRRRLHSLISPDTPPSPPTPEAPRPRHRIARKY